MAVMNTCCCCGVRGGSIGSAVYSLVSAVVKQLPAFSVKHPNETVQDANAHSLKQTVNLNFISKLDNCFIFFLLEDLS